MGERKQAHGSLAPLHEPEGKGEERPVAAGKQDEVVRAQPRLNAQRFFARSSCVSDGVACELRHSGKKTASRAQPDPLSAYMAGEGHPVNMLGDEGWGELWE